MAAIVVPQRRSESSMTLAALLIMVFILLAGFGPTYYLNPTNAVTFRTLTHIHAFTMVLWVALFVVQVTLVRSRNIKQHIRLGTAGAALAIIMSIIAIGVAVQAAKYGSVSTPAGIDPLSFMAVPVLNILIFDVLFAAAVILRKRAADHRRLMILTMIALLGPGLGRLKIESLAALGPIFFLGFPVLLGIGLLVYDSWRNRRINRAFLLGLLFLLAGSVAMVAIGSTSWWMAFARWATT